MDEVLENKNETKKEIHKAHERAFKSAMQDLRIAKDFFSHHLPQNILGKIDLNTLKLHRETFIDTELTELVADMLYSAEFKDENNKGQRVLLYLLVEHQRMPEILMPWRMVKYTVRAIDQYLTETGNKVLPLLVPIVVYNGDGPYPYSASVFDLFGENKGLAKAFLFNQFQLIDLSQIPDETIRQHQWCGFMEMVMKHIDARDIMVYLEKISDLVDKLVSLRADSYILSMIKYVIEKSEIPNREIFYDWTQTHLLPPLEDETMTLAEQLRTEGYQQGMEQGRQQARTLAEQLRTEGYQQGMEQGRQQARTLAEQLRTEGYQEGMEQGRQQARTLAEQLRTEGYQEGMEQGRQQARTLAEQLRTEGYQQGMEQGRQQARTLAEQLRTEGYQQGKQQGRQQGMQKTLELLHEGKSLEEIAQLIEQSLSDRE